MLTLIYAWHTSHETNDARPAVFITALLCDTALILFFGAKVLT